MKLVLCCVAATPRHFEAVPVVSLSRCPECQLPGAQLTFISQIIPTPAAPRKQAQRLCQPFSPDPLIVPQRLKRFWKPRRQEGGSARKRKKKKRGTYMLHLDIRFIFLGHRVRPLASPRQHQCHCRSPLCICCCGQPVTVTVTSPDVDFSIFSTTHNTSVLSPIPH